MFPEASRKAECPFRYSTFRPFDNKNLFAVKQKFIDQTESDGEAGVLSALSKTVLIVETLRIPNLRRNQIGGVIADDRRGIENSFTARSSRRHAGKQSVFKPRTEIAPFVFVKFAVEFQGFFDAVGRRFLNGVFAEVRGETPPETFDVVFPFRRIVGDLLNHRAPVPTPIKPVPVVLFR